MSMLTAMACSRSFKTSLLLAALCVSTTVVAQTVGDLTDSTAEGQVLKAAAERAEAAYKLTHGKTVEQQVADRAKQANASHPVPVMATETPLPPPPPPPPSMSGPTSVPNSN